MEDSAIAYFNPLSCCLNVLYRDATRLVFILCFSKFKSLCCGGFSLEKQFVLCFAYLNL